MSRLINRWVIMALILVVGLVCFVWRDASEQFSDSAVEFFSADVAPKALTDPQVAQVKGFYLAPLRNNVHELSVSGLRVLAPGDSRHALDFMLQSQAPHNDYPTLQVRLYSAAGALLRTVSFAPSQYSHGGDLSAEEIHLDLEVLPSEVREDVQPVYARGAP